LAQLVDQFTPTSKSLLPLVLTPAGHHYLPYINEAMSKIAEGTGEILANNGDSHDTPALLPRSKSDF
jgi:DNA-binding transcriptional LysR family regulator